MFSLQCGPLDFSGLHIERVKRHLPAPIQTPSMIVGGVFRQTMTNQFTKGSFDEALALARGCLVLEIDPAPHGRNDVETFDTECTKRCQSLGYDKPIRLKVEKIHGAGWRRPLKRPVIERFDVRVETRLTA